MFCNTERDQKDLARYDTLIDIYFDAIEALTTGGVQSYTLDTGQTSQTVTKNDLAKLRNSLTHFRNEHRMLLARLTGCNSFNASACS